MQIPRIKLREFIFCWTWSLGGFTVKPYLFIVSSSESFS
jgi:hypothetical protein